MYLCSHKKLPSQFPSIFFTTKTKNPNDINTNYMYLKTVVHEIILTHTHIYIHTLSWSSLPCLCLSPPPPLSLSLSISVNPKARIDCIWNNLKTPSFKSLNKGRYIDICGCMYRFWWRWMFTVLVLFFKLHLVQTLMREKQLNKVLIRYFNHIHTWFLYLFIGRL